MIVTIASFLPTRDSFMWIVGIVSSICVYLLAHYDKLQAAFPGLHPEWQARIEILAALLAILAAKMSWSPLPRSADTPLPPTRVDTPR